MFNVDPTTRKITMHRGDTGEVTFTATGRTFGADDRAMFTIKDSSGSEIVKTYYELDDGEFTVEFTNPMTDYLSAGQYKYDIRYIIDPTWEGEGAEAHITNGDDVKTPGSPFILELLDTVGQV